MLWLDFLTMRPNNTKAQNWAKQAGSGSVPTHLPTLGFMSPDKHMHVFGKIPIIMK